MRPKHLLSVADLAARARHGTLAKHRGGCRCLPCRSARSEYERRREAAKKSGDWNGQVSTARARRHLEKLSAAGVGRRSVVKATGIPEPRIRAIKNGKKAWITARTERRILAVTAAQLADRALVPSAGTVRRLEQLVAEGFTRIELGRRLGLCSKNLPFRRPRVTVKTARQVRAFFNSIMAGSVGVDQQERKGQPGKKVTPAEERRIVYYLRNSEEMSWDEIAAYFNRTHTCIASIARKHGIRRYNRKDGRTVNRELRVE